MQWLAGEKSSDYQPFLAGLKPDGTGGLTSRAGPVKALTWYTLEVKYQQNVFANLSGALAYGKYKSWVALYQSALDSAKSASWQLKDYQSVKQNLEKQEDDARVLLAGDFDLTDTERTTLADEANSAINAAFAKHYLSRLPDNNPPPLVDVGNNVRVPGKPPVVMGHNDEMINTAQRLFGNVHSKAP